MTARRLSEDDFGPVTPLTDLSATILTLLILILIVTLSVAGANRSAPPPPAPITLNRRAPIDAAMLVDALHRRQRRGPGPLIEVHRDLVRVIRAEGPTDLPRGSGHLAEASRAALAAPAEAAPALPLVFVFDQRTFADVAQGLAGTAYLDVTVPAAFRDCGPAPAAQRLPRPAPEAPGRPCAEGDDWSSGFLALGATSLDDPAFRRALAALLDAEADSRAGERDPRPPARIGTDAAPGRPVPAAALALVVALLGLALESRLTRRRDQRPGPSGDGARSR